MSNRLAHARTWLATFLAAFAAFWTLADPLGGMDYVVAHISTKTSAYVAIGLFSALCATAVLTVQLLLESRRFEASMTFGETRMSLDYRRMVTQCKHRFIVVGLSLPTFASEAMIRAYDQALSAGRTVDIVLLNPLSPSFLQRSPDLYRGHEAPHLTAARSLRVLVKHKESLPPEISARFRVRLVDALPALAAVVADERCYWHPYFISTTGVMSPYLRASTRSGFGRFVFEHVQSILSPESSFEASLDAGALTNRLNAGQGVSFRQPAEAVRAVRKELQP